MINKELLSDWLEHLEYCDYSSDTVFALLNPDNPQDVPRAVKLLLYIADLKNLETSNYSPAEKKTFASISLLAEMLHSLLEPFINSELSLSQQLEHLSKFGHISCALFLKNGTDFMSNQLYGDLQCMIKNAYFTVAKAKLLSPEYKMFICLLGDDVLEALFGRARMIGGHCPNCTIGELGRRFGSVLNCASILHRHPEWERKPDRLKMFRSQDFDHLRPRNWKGDVRVGPINLQACWDSGIINA
ncbi:hypothetical protein K435DRAFT_648944, partial [Dendrothele bispora CBS 962.96]